VALYTISRADAPGDATRPSNVRIYNVLIGLGYDVPDGGVSQDEANIYVDADSDPTTDVNAIDPFDLETLRIQDHFLNTRGWGSAGPGTVAQQPSTDESIPGLIRVATGASSGNQQRIFLGDSGSASIVHSDGQFEMSWKVIHVDQSLNNQVLRFGFSTDWSADPAGSGIWFEFDPADGANWQYVCRTSGTQTSTDSGIPPSSGVFQTLRVRKVRGAGAPCTFSITTETTPGVDVAVSTNVPADMFGPGMSIRTNNATTKRVEIDAFRLDLMGVGW
jgi:hypothetical protein